MKVFSQGKFAAGGSPKFTQRNSKTLDLRDVRGWVSAGSVLTIRRGAILANRQFR